MSAPSSAALLAQQLHKLRSAALQWLSSHYPSMSFSEAEDLVSEGVANYYERLSAGTIALDTDFMRYTFKAIQNMASKSVRHLGRVTSSDDIDQERSEAFSTETSEETAICIESAETLLDEVAKLTDDSGDALWKDQCIELVNRCIGELQDPCMTILRCFYYHNLSMTEIAEEVGLKNADTAKAKKNQCMKRLLDNVKGLGKF